MNQNSIQNSGHRYSRKRNSYDAIKTSFSLKNAKKSLPEVCIDLNEHNKKQKMLMQQRMIKAKQPAIQISYYDQKRKGKGVKKKDQLTLKNMYNTQFTRNQDQNKNILNQYRDEIQILKLQNERLKEENDKLKLNDKYLNRKIKEISEEKHGGTEELKEYTIFLEKKVENYSNKIKNLYEELIKEKKKKSKSTSFQSRNDRTVDSRIRQNFDRQEELYSYRMPNSKQETNRYKKFTSPSSNDFDKLQWTQQIEAMMMVEKKGEEAYYKAKGGYYGTYSDTS